MADQVKFGSVEALWRALERYHHYHDGTIIRSLDGGRRGANEELGIQLTDEWLKAMAANRAIDRAMARLRLIEPKLHLLLDHYYRRGLCEEANGWSRAAAKAGLTFGSDRHIGRGAFDWILERAVWVLFALHRMERRR